MDLRRIANFLFEVGTLRKIPRAHRQTLLTDDVTDNISSHSYRVSMIGYFLAIAAKADVAKVLLMCLFHDVPESRSNDQNWIHKKYVKVFEEEIIADQFTDLDPGNKILETIREYLERETIEAKLAKDADLIDQVLLLREHEHTGNREATKWLESKAEGTRLLTDEGRALLHSINETGVSDWWKLIWTADRRE